MRGVGVMIKSHMFELTDELFNAMDREDVRETVSILKDQDLFQAPYHMVSFKFTLGNISRRLGYDLRPAAVAAVAKSPMRRVSVERVLSGVQTVVCELINVPMFQPATLPIEQYVGGDHLRT